MSGSDIEMAIAIQTHYMPDEWFFHGLVTM
jgi:hypothetical protein